MKALHVREQVGDEADFASFLVDLARWSKIWLGPSQIAGGDLMRKFPCKVITCEMGSLARSTPANRPPRLLGKDSPVETDQGGKDSDIK